MNARLFLALWPDDTVRAQLAAWRDAWTWPRGATPVRSDRLHMTLHFIGEVAEARIGEAEHALDVPVSPFDLAFGTTHVWPHGIAVLEPISTPPALTELHHWLRARLLALALPVDGRSYKPHVTLARRADAASAHGAGPAIHWPVTGYALMRSRPGQGAAYEVLRHYPAQPI